MFSTLPSARAGNIQIPDNKWSHARVNAGCHENRANLAAQARQRLVWFGPGPTASFFSSMIIDANVSSEKSELILDPNFAVIMVFSSDWINTEEKASSIDASHDMDYVDYGHFAGIEHFRTSKSGYRKNLPERLITQITQRRN